MRQPPKPLLATGCIVAATGLMPLAVLAGAEPVTGQQFAPRTIDQVAAAETRQRDPLLQRQSSGKAALRCAFGFHFWSLLLLPDFSPPPAGGRPLHEVQQDGEVFSRTRPHTQSRPHPAHLWCAFRLRFPREVESQLRGRQKCYSHSTTLKLPTKLSFRRETDRSELLISKSRGLNQFGGKPLSRLGVHRSPSTFTSPS
jgi:hypothetical protein